MRYAHLALFAFLVACSGAEPALSVDGGPADMAGLFDSASDADDAEDLALPVDLVSADLAPDLAHDDVPLAGFGDITGDCGVLDDELTSSDSHFVQNVIDFGMDPYDDADLMLLTPGGQEIIADGNAGGDSLLSEVFAYEVLARCERATLLKTETEVVYADSMGKITDLLVEMDGHKIGVSVTRALAFPFEDPYTPQQADVLLTDKLSDVLLSTANVTLEDAWSKQVLHILAYSPMHADSLRTAYESLDPAVRSDTVVFVTITNGADDPLY